MEKMLEILPVWFYKFIIYLFFKKNINFFCLSPLQRTSRFHLQKGWSMTTLIFRPFMVIGDSHYSTITERVKVCKKGGYYGNKIERRGNVEFFLRAV
jgi:hypothetical protein